MAVFSLCRGGRVVVVVVSVVAVVIAVMVIMKPLNPLSVAAADDTTTSTNNGSNNRLAHPEGFSPAGLKVLVVDDDLLCLMILERMLRQCKYAGE